MSQLDFVRLIVFVFGLVLFTVLGDMFPYKSGVVFQKRWFVNIFFGAVNALLISLSIKQFSYSQTFSFYEADFGLMSLIHIHWSLKLLLGLIILDFVIYWQHRFFHKIPILWRMHRLHHSDLIFDTSTALRFHPTEALFSLGVRFLTAYIFGISFLTLAVFEIILNFAAMFNHSNFTFEPELHRKIRNFIITPDLHRVHHSLDAKDSNHNFGFSISVWDLLFKTFKKRSHLDLRADNIGVLGFQTESSQKLTALLLQPLDS